MESVKLENENACYIPSDYEGEEEEADSDCGHGESPKISQLDSSFHPNQNGHAKQNGQVYFQASVEFSERNGIQACYNWWVITERWFLACMEKNFELFARKVALNPWKVIGLVLLLCCLSGLGLLRLKTENRIDKLYIPSNTLSERAMKEAMPYFINNYNSRQEEVIFISKSNKNFMSGSCVAESKKVIKEILNIPKYRQLCKLKPPFLKNYKQYNKNESCMILNPLEILSDSSRAANVSASFGKAITDKETLMSNGRPASFNVKIMFSDLSTRSYGSTATAYASTQGLRVIFFMQQAESGYLYKELMQWEEHFINTLKRLNNDLACLDISFAAERSISDSISESTDSDIRLMAATFTVMIFISGLIHGSKTNPVRGHSLLSSFAAYTSGLGILVGFGLVIGFGLPFISIIGMLQLLVASIGIDGVFIILDEFDKLPKAMPANRKVSHVFAKVGATITMTTLTDIIVFLVGISSNFPAIRYFCIFAAVTFTAEFAIQMTLFVALLSLDARRIKAGRRDCLPFCKGQDKEMCWEWKKNLRPSKIMGRYGNFLLKWPSKVLVLLLAIGILAGGIYGFLNINKEFNRMLLTKDGSYYKKYLKVVEEKFSNEIEVSLLNIGSISPFEQNKVIKAPKVAFSSGFYLHRNVSWLTFFQTWAHSNQIKINESNFEQNVELFLKNPQHSFFNNDVIRDKSGSILASRILVYMKGQLSSTSHSKAMKRLRNLLNDNEIPLAPMANQFLYFEQYLAITDEVTRNLLFAAAVVAIITGFFCIHPLITILIVLELVVLVVDLFGLMYFWSVSLDSISMLALVMSVGLSVDYSAHVAHAFSMSGKNQVDHRIVDALSNVGWSVLMGGLSTFLGMLVLAFSSSDIFLTFFRMFLGTVVFGLFNGLVLSPVLISVLACRFKDMNVFRLPAWLVKKKEEFQVNQQIKSKGSKWATNNINDKLISIVGISARFPTAKNKEKLWEVLVNGRRTLDEYPACREARSVHFRKQYNPNRPVMGRLYVTKGSYLENIEMFDNSFFGISHTEARLMDPQQRMLLQNVFEATEDAGLKLEDLQTCRTGVYVGLMNWDYEGVLRHYDSLLDSNQFSGTGPDPSIAANRISFSLNLTGPSVHVNTACSSSLTALGIAYDHLKSGRCDIAIVASANIILDPIKHRSICQANMLASDGQSKAFDASADGYGRGEGVATVILKPNVVADTDGDHIYCNILSCGLNSDGRGAIPMTAPSNEGQQKLFQDVLAASGIRADDVHYVEAHGTGTIIGDRVETKSIADVYSSMRTADNPLKIGSVKSNVNHTESVSGLAGLIKVCLMIKNKKFVPTVGIKHLNPALQTEERGIKVQQALEEWNDDWNGPRTAAINSFGYGGSNGHVIVQEEVKKPKETVTPEEYPTSVQTPRVLVLSAHSVAALQEVSQKFSQWLSGMNESNQTALDICYSLYQRRTHHNHRMVVGFDTISEAAHLLQSYSEEESEKNRLLRLAGGKVFSSSSKVGFVFGGQGSSRPRIIEVLCQNHFMKECFEQIESQIRNFDPDLSIFQEENTNDGLGIEESQALISLKIFAAEYAIAQFLIKKTAIFPMAVAGHSLGDITAACVSGYISLRHAIHVIIIRSKLQDECSDKGYMMAIGMPLEETESLVDELKLSGKVVVASKNAKGSVTLSGDSEAVSHVEQHLKSARPEVFCRILKVKKAFHSHHMDPLRNEFIWQVDKINLGIAKKEDQVCSSLYSTVKGKRVSCKAMTTDYFWENLRNPVLFDDAIQSMLSDGCRVLIEVSPLPLLSRYLTNIVKSTTLGTDEDPVHILQSLPRLQESDMISHLYVQCVGRLYTLGYQVCWDQLFDYSKCSFIRYPSYAWQESKIWCYEDMLDNDNVTRLLGFTKENTTSTGIVWENDIDCATFNYLYGHSVRNFGPVFPGAGYLEIAMESVIGGPHLESITVDDLMFENVLTLPSDMLRRVQTTMMLDEANKKSKLEISHKGPTGDNIVLALATVGKVNCSARKEKKSLSAYYIDPRREKDRCIDSAPYRIQEIQNDLNDSIIQKEAFLEMARKCGFEYTGDFTLIERVWKSSDSALCKVELTEEVKRSLGSYVLHPAIIDVCFQSCIALLDVNDESFQDDVQVFPVGVRRVTLIPPLNDVAQLYCLTSAVSKDTYNMELLTDSGEALLVMEEFKVTRVGNRHDSQIQAYKIGFHQYEDLNSIKSKETADVLLLNCQEDEALLGTFCKVASDVTTGRINALSLDATINSSDVLTTVKDSICIRSKEFSNPLVVAILFPTLTNREKSQAEDLIKCQKQTVVFCLEILKLLSKMNMQQTTLGVVTRNTVMWQVDDGFSDANYPIAAAITGLARTARLEQSSVKVICADIGTRITQAECSKVLQCFSKGILNTELLIRNDKYFCPRLERLTPEETIEGEKYLQASPSFTYLSKYLSFSPVTQRFDVKLHPSLPPPKSNEVEVKVSFISSFSSEISPLLENIKMVNAVSTPKFVIGNVSRAGEVAKETFVPGSQIMVCCESVRIQSSFCSSADQVVRLSDTMSASQIATKLPTFVNGFQILKKTISISPKAQNVLVVFGKSGYGLSLSITVLAKALNLNVHCAGSLHKETMESLSVKRWSYQEVVQYVHQSKPLFDSIYCPSSIGDTVMLAVSKLLKPEACFVLLDCSSQAEYLSVPVPTTSSCVRLNAVQAPYLQVKEINVLWKECMDLLKSSNLLSTVLVLPCRIIPVADVVEGIAYPSTGFQTLELGLIDNDITEGKVMIRCPSLDSFGMKETVCYLVIGGARGFGLETLKWLIRRGAKYVIACGRSKLTDTTVETFYQIEKQSGAKISYVQADISTSDGIEVLERSLLQCPPLVGVIASAVVYDDKLFTEIDEQSMLKVLKPKVIGTILLYELLERLQIELDFFVLYSSITSLGNIGQSSYSAANTFLDNFAGYIAYVVGKRCLSVNWGALRIGELERNETVARQLETDGHGLLDPQKALDYMEQILVKAPSMHNVVIADVDWSTFLRGSRNEANPFYEKILKEIQGDVNTRQPNNSLAERIQAAENDEEKYEIVRNFVTNWLASWSGGIEADVDLQMGLYQYGVDSTGAVGFQMQLQRQLGMPVEVGDLKVLYKGHVK